MNLVWTHPSGGKLWQGEARDTLRWDFLKAEGVGLVILCAREFQPKFGKRFEVIRLKFEDDPYMEHTMGLRTAYYARNAADLAFERLEKGTSVLSSCWMGLNRSGLVSGMILVRHCGMSADEAVKRIRSARTYVAMGNPVFRELLDREALRVAQRTSGRDSASS
jgi:protein-tyrosine phosphatase